MNDTCNAMTKNGSVMLVCDLLKGHRLPDGRPSDHVDQTKQQKWADDANRDVPRLV